MRSWLITTHPVIETPKTVFVEHGTEANALLKLETESRRLREPLILWYARAETSVHERLDVNVKEIK